MAQIDVVVPVYNEQDKLVPSITRLREFLTQNLTHNYTIIIASNGSTDATAEVGLSLSRQYPDVRLLDLKVKGRGWALYQAWHDSQADIVSYMDVDLSTGLDAFPRLIEAIESGYDIAIGSRLLPNSHIQRSLRREILSRGYNLIVRALFLAKFYDMQCGFKAFRTDSIRKLLPLIEDRQWFFDTEILLIASKKGYRIKEVPVSWIESGDSRVVIGRTVRDHLVKLVKMRFRHI
jgi:glycosyltransferase involved in cell wall biosynthesis